MRIAVFGLGAVGGHIAVRLARAGHDVSAVARGATFAAVTERGLTLISGADRLVARITVARDGAELGPQDLVIVATKATTPRQTARGIAPLIGPNTTVIFAQNGIPWWYAIGARQPALLPDLTSLDPGGCLAAVVPTGAVIGAVIQSPNEVVEPGVICNASARNSLIVGEVDDVDTPRIRRLRDMLAAAGLASPPVDDIRRVIWAKLSTNMSASMLCLLTGRRLSVLREDAALAALARALAAEVTAIAVGHGHAVTPEDSERVIANPSDHMPSVRQDFDRRRPLELDAMLLMPLSFARPVGIATPHLDTIAALAVRLARDAGVYR